MAKRKTYKEGYENGVRDVFAAIMENDYCNINIGDLAFVAEEFGISDEEFKTIIGISEEDEEVE